MSTAKKLTPTSYLKKKVYEKVSTTKKKGKKVSDEEFKILKIGDYEQLMDRQYKISQLKDMCSHYKLKKGGNKTELIDRLYNFLKFSLYVVNIQRVVRGHFMRSYIKLAGPAFRDRSLCINDSDFATLEPLNEITYNQFISFRDDENNIYGCDIMSLYGLLHKKSKYEIRQNRKIPLNPYNRNPVSEELINDFTRYIRLAKVNKIEHILEDEPEEINPEKQLELKILQLFQYINELGNYANSEWFNNLSRHRLVLFIREMYDIWNYRAQLTPQSMREIVPPHGNPFIGLNMHLAQNQTDTMLKRNAFRVMDYLVNSGHTNDNRSLGAYYVLAALTLVSEDARIALPWLFQSVAHSGTTSLS